MSVPETSKSTEASINSYKNFGLRENETYGWVSSLVESGKDFLSWNPSHPLGKPMVNSAKLWFRQCGLVDNKLNPTKMVELFRQQGSLSVVGWEIIWISLVNNAKLLRWFVNDLEVGCTYSLDDLSSKLTNYFPEEGKSTIEGGLAALKDTLTKSPLAVTVSEEEVNTLRRIISDAINPVLLVCKGKKILSVTRRPKNIQSLTLLYSLYFIAMKTERTAFTIREMMTTEKDSTYVSPLTAFGFDADTFQRQCQGLRSKYPDYISTTFTHGNDEFEVHPEKHNLIDIIDLCLAEN